MADNIGYTPGTGATVGADLIGGVLYQRVKLTFGADGTATDVSASDPLPVTGTFYQATQPVSLASAVAVTGTFWQATQPVSGTFWQATQPVSGTFWQATQPVSAAALPLPSGAATETTLGTRALEAGGNLAGAATSLAVMDDWDESDRLKANIIVGQAGIAAGAGAVGATVPRFTLASDDPGVASLALIAASASVLDDWDESDRAKVNLIAGSAGVDGNSGVKSAATVRVVIATDQPQLTNKLLVTPDANSAVNVAQINGVTPLMGTGNTGTGSVRVTIATDQAQLTNKLLVTPDANSAVNVAQMNGATVSMGAGAVGTGVQRNTLASDDPAVAALNIIKAPGLSAAVTVTRPSDTTAYTAGDVCGPTGGGTSGIDFNLAAVSGSNIMITSVALQRNVTALISGETSYKLYLYNVTPPGASADNAAFDLPSGDRASYLGVIDMGTPVDLGSTLYVETNGINKQVKLSGTHIFGYLVTVGAYTPASASVLVVTLNAVQL